MNLPTRPVLRYHGGKWRIAEWIASHFPPHTVYVEPFGGAASVLMHKQPARIEVYNDLDDCVVGLFRILRDPVQAEALRRAVELTPFSRSEFESCWAVSEDPLEEARRLIVRSFQSIGAKNRLSQNGWRTRTAKSLWSPCLAWNGWPSAIPTFTAQLKSVIIENSPWRKVFDIYDDPAALIYLDPPYVLETRSSDLRKLYAHELSDGDHREMLERLQAARSMVILSGYHHPMYDAALAGWQRAEIQARAQTNAPRTEVLWINPAGWAALHEGQDLFAGEGRAA